MISSSTVKAARPAAPIADAMDYDARLRVTGTGPPLIYVPGMDGTGELFYRQVPALARRYRVATYRLRDDATAMDTLAADLETLALRLGEIPITELRPYRAAAE